MRSSLHSPIAPSTNTTTQTEETTAFKKTTPDPNCVDILKFSLFKSRMLSKISNDVDKHNHPANQDNVFKLLMQKIKTLETTMAIMELYSTQLYECYKQQSVNITIPLHGQPTPTLVINETSTFRIPYTVLLIRTTIC
jgi:hypothetical protein